MNLRSNVSLFFLCCLSTTGLFAQTPITPPQFRLPNTAAPESYKVNLTVVPDKDTFSGTVDIVINLKEPTSLLWLNAEKLTIKSATLAAGAQSLTPHVITEPKDVVGFSFDQPVKAGEVKLHVDYEGEVSRKDMAGIFQVKDGEHWYIYSQFENIAARRAFPCFDEPAYKVVWQVTLNVPAEDGAFSNTPVISEKPAAGGMKTVEFAETKPLPSYLVAIAVGPMEIVEAGHAGANNTAIRIIVPKGHAAEAQYVAKATPDIVNLLEKYFTIPYPYEKLDEVAIPLAGYAMEHPGLVTYGSQILLIKPDTPLATKRLAVSVIAHELAHQWFGDLVTTAWWDDVWLNEGFASWMANKIVNQYHPEWNMNIDELNSYEGAMATDELVSSRKVRQPILSNDDIENAFDNITYEKGSGLLNMFESYVGPENFRQGIYRYLRKYSWKTATSAEFLQEIGGNSPQVAKAFSTFLDQAGVPLLTAKLQCKAQGGAELQLSQERFFPRGSQGNSAQLWDIPVCVKYSSSGAEARECALVTGKEQTITLSKARGCPTWFDANADGAGYYHVIYQRPALESLAQNKQKLSLAERVAFLDDIAAVTKGYMPLGEAMGLMPNFAQDSEAEVTIKTTHIVGGLDDNLVPDPLKANYRRYLSDLYKKRAQEVGWKDTPEDSPSVRLLRPQLFALMANQAEDAEFIAQAKRLALAWLDDHAALDHDMLDSVLNSAAAHGDRALFDRLHAAAGKESDETVKDSLLGAMGRFRDPEITRAALAILMSNEFDVHQSVGDILGGARAWPETHQVAYDFVKQNWDPLIAKLPTDWGAYLPFVTAGFCDEQHRADAEAFFTGRSTKYTGGPRNLAQRLERIDLCVANKNANQASVAEFLSKY